MISRIVFVSFVIGRRGAGRRVRSRTSNGIGCKRLERRLSMAKKTWLKGALIMALSGSLLGISYGCLDGFVQRILIAAQFD
jgi:hypothetical protein